MKFLGFIFVFDSVHFSVILPVYLKIHVIRPLVLSVQVTSVTVNNKVLVGKHEQKRPRGRPGQR
jgi:hypothetical protein